MVARRAMFHFKYKLFLEEDLKRRIQQRPAGIENDPIFTAGNVLSGPFKGMRYIDRSTGSSYLPKIIGSYEDEIAQWIQEIKIKDYNTIIDVGCAEGYYAVGLSLLCPKSQVIAFDVNPLARELCEKLAKLNDVKVEIGSLFDPSQFVVPNGGRVLLFVDVEGAELQLLDPKRYPWQRDVDVIVEAHDNLFGYGNNSQQIVERFRESHRCEVVYEAPLSWKAAKLRANFPNLDGIETIIDEIRVGKMKWMRGLARP
jgi:hypothetical protein